MTRYYLLPSPSPPLFAPPNDLFSPDLRLPYPKTTAVLSFGVAAPPFELGGWDTNGPFFCAEYRSLIRSLDLTLVHPVRHVQDYARNRLGTSVRMFTTLFVAYSSMLAKLCLIVCTSILWTVVQNVDRNSCRKEYAILYDAGRSGRTCTDRRLCC